MHPVFKQNIEVIGKPYQDLLFLLQCLHEVLIENNEILIAESIPWLNESIQIKQNIDEQKLTHLYSISFQLLNLCEVNGAVQSRRAKQQTQGQESIIGSWAHTFSELKKQKINSEAILQALSRIEIDPVLTAHPTEAKRTVVLKYYRELYLQMVKLENQMYTKYERLRIKTEIKEILNKLWFIDDIYLEKPKVETELENMLYYLTDVFPEVFELHDRQIIQAWEEYGYGSVSVCESRQLPKIKLSTWVGGDRDGHSLVTPEVTQYTLRRLRTEALSLLKTKLLKLADSLSIYINENNLPDEFTNYKNELTRQIGSLTTTDFNKAFPFEPFKQFVFLIIEKLPFSSDHTTDYISLSDKPYSYSRSNQLIADLEVLHEALVDWGASSIAINEVSKAIRFTKTFGFHLARLDVRQNSVYYGKALLGLLNDAECLAIYLNHDGLFDKKFLERELMLYRPFTRSYLGDIAESASVLGYLNVLNDHVSKYGTNAIGSLIISMTRSVEDLYVLYLLARESGLYVKTPKGPACVLSIVPLFETIDDLKRAPEILDEYLSNPVTRNSLELQQQKSGTPKPVIEVMIGYSDSNKDGGILASQWHLFDSQLNMTVIAKKHSVDIRFFHGKGGSISRGAGPMHWFLRSLPPGSLSGKIRLTEQGETIERKYANKLNATFNIELLASGTLYNLLLQNNTIDPNFLELMRYMADESYKAFTGLTKHKNFIQYYEQATPIDVIESSKIGSRPTRRTNQRTLNDLRAIPWVFSWSQSRVNITSWYGVGSTLEKLKEQEPSKYQYLKSLVPSNPMVRYLLTNIDSGLAATDPDIMTIYASLVSDEAVKIDILSMIQKEFILTKQLLAELLEKPFEKRRQNHYYSTRLRAVALEPIHKLQVNAIREWRKNKDLSVDSNNQISLLLKTINAIANALGTTG